MTFGLITSGTSCLGETFLNEGALPPFLKKWFNLMSMSLTMASFYGSTASVLS